MAKEDVKTDPALEAANELTAALSEESDGTNILENELEAKAEKTDDKAKEKAVEDKAVEKSGDEKKTEVPQVDDSLLERAVKAGIPLAKAKSFKSADDLETAVTTLETAKPSEKPSEGKPAEEKKDEPVENFDDLKEEGFDPRLIDRLNKMAVNQKALTDENKTLKSQLGEVSTNLKSQGTVKVEQEFNTRFDKLGEDFSKDFGKGEWSKLDQNGAETKQRAAVVSEMAAMVSGYKALNKSVPDQETLFKRAVYNVTGRIPSEAKAEVKDPIPDKLKDQAGKTVGKPASSTKQNTAAGELNQALRELEDELGR